MADIGFLESEISRFAAESRAEFISLYGDKYLWSSIFDTGTKNTSSSASSVLRKSAALVFADSKSVPDAERPPMLNESSNNISTEAGDLSVSEPRNPFVNGAANAITMNISNAILQR